LFVTRRVVAWWGIAMWSVTRYLAITLRIICTWTSGKI
jgi:hypothetical protein